MKKSIIALAFVAFIWNSNNVTAQSKPIVKQDIKVGIDLIDVRFQSLRC